MALFSADLPNCGCLTDVRHETGKFKKGVIPRGVSDEGSAVENTGKRRG
jgi:hypothetical protein